MCLLEAGEVIQILKCMRTEYPLSFDCTSNLEDDGNRKRARGDWEVDQLTVLSSGTYNTNNTTTTDSMGNKQSGNGAAGAGAGFDGVSGTRTGDSRKAPAGSAAVSVGDVRSAKASKPTKAPRTAVQASEELRVHAQAQGPFGADQLSIQGTHLQLTPVSPHKVAPTPGEVMTLRHMNPTNPNSHSGQLLHVVPSALAADSARPASPTGETVGVGGGGRSGRSSRSNTHTPTSSSNKEALQGVGGGSMEGISRSDSKVGRWEQQRQDSFKDEGRAEEVEEQAPSAAAVPAQAGQGSGGAGPSNNFDFSMTEGQTRRTLMADCEFECSQVSPGTLHRRLCVRVRVRVCVEYVWSVCRHTCYFANFHTNSLILHSTPRAIT